MAELETLDDVANGCSINPLPQSSEPHGPSSVRPDHDRRNPPVRRSQSAAGAGTAQHSSPPGVGRIRFGNAQLHVANSRNLPTDRRLPASACLLCSHLSPFPSSGSCSANSSYAPDWERPREGGGADAQFLESVEMESNQTCPTNCLHSNSPTCLLWQKDSSECQWADGHTDRNARHGKGIFRRRLPSPSQKDKRSPLTGNAETHSSGAVMYSSGNMTPYKRQWHHKFSGWDVTYLPTCSRGVSSPVEAPARLLRSGCFVQRTSFRSLSRRCLQENMAA